MSTYLKLLISPIMVLSIIGFFAFISFLEKRSFRKSLKRRNNRWTTLDSTTPKVDSKIKKIDASFYKEGRYIIVRGHLCTVCIEDRKIVRFVSRLIAHKQDTIEVFSSDKIIGKLVFDRAHASRYIRSFWYGADI